MKEKTGPGADTSLAAMRARFEENKGDSAFDAAMAVAKALQAKKAGA